MARFGDLGEDTFGGGMGSPSQVNNDNFYDKIKTTMDPGSAFGMSPTPPSSNKVSGSAMNDDDEDEMMPF